MLSFSIAAMAQARLGIKAGYQMANMRINFANAGYPVPDNPDTKTVPGFQAGLMADIPLSAHFSVQPGLFYSKKGADYSHIVPGPADGPVNLSVHYRIDYLELPVYFLYKLPLGAGKLFGGVGPSLAYGIDGYLQSDYSGYKTERQFVFLNKTDYRAGKQYMKPFDFAGNAMLGYELSSGWLISLHYSQGLSDIAPDNNLKAKNHAFGISAGYLFRH